ncbi:hypothetical protein CYMTET_47477 [Cymbomonas tetramitiformis]|uniref:Uncharacterized protein n=1 Tax=Cymbomonas tetramitiformis TaxID=36881 RepID=A0AAE0EWK3_9CHLO|nr:hypothetical protein CYMTET_47477 [Cymbomonas tetramitiformis]
MLSALAEEMGEELAEAGQLPTPAALAADFDDRQSFDEDDDCPGMESGDDSDEEEIPLDERPEDMVDQPRKERVTPLRPSSLMQVELTGRVDLHAEDLKFDNPAPGTSVTDKMLHLLQATSCGQRESNMMMRSEWGGPEGAVDAALTTPAGPTATQFDPRHPDLTQEQEAASEKEYNLASTQPWQGMHGSTPMGWCDQGGQLVSTTPVR